MMNTIHKRLFNVNRKLHVTIANWPKHERGSSPCTLKFRITAQYDVCMRHIINLEYYKNKKTLGMALGELRIYKMLIEEAQMAGCIGQGFNSILMREIEQCISIIDNAYKKI